MVHTCDHYFPLEEVGEPLINLMEGGRGVCVCVCVKCARESLDIYSSKTKLQLLSTLESVR